MEKIEALGAIGMDINQNPNSVKQRRRAGEGGGVPESIWNGLEQKTNAHNKVSI